MKKAFQPLMFSVCILSCLVSSRVIAAQPEPVDLLMLSTAMVTRQLADFAAGIESYYPYLKTASARAKFNAKTRRLENSVTGPMPAWRAWLLQQQLVRGFDDPHLAVYPNAIEDQALAVDFNWVSDGLLISPASWMHPALFPKNCQVLRINGITPKQLLPKLEALYSGVPEWVKVQAYTLRYAYALRWLGLLDAHGRVALIMRTPQGKLLRLRLSLAPVPTGRELKQAIQAAYPHGWFYWHVDRSHNLGWFTLDKMQLTGPYERSVAAFFHKVESDGITRVVVDLRHNGGGASLAEAPFLQYLGVAKIRDYTTTKYFDPQRLQQEVTHLNQELKKLAPPGTKISAVPSPQAPSADQLFHGRFYLATGPGSFSSAMEFAADVKFNRLGTIVGMPPGELVTGPGDVKFFPHPPSGVPFQVPTDLNTWPGVKSGAVVKPDVVIPLTVHDVQASIDPVRRWFKNPVHSQSTK